MQRLGRVQHPRTHHVLALQAPRLGVLAVGGDAVDVVGDGHIARLGAVARDFGATNTELAEGVVVAGDLDHALLRHLDPGLGIDDAGAARAQVQLATWHQGGQVLAHGVVGAPHVDLDRRIPGGDVLLQLVGTLHQLVVGGVEFHRQPCQPQRRVGQRRQAFQVGRGGLDAVVAAAGEGAFDAQPGVLDLAQRGLGFAVGDLGCVDGLHRFHAFLAVVANVQVLGQFVGAVDGLVGGALRLFDQGQRAAVVEGCRCDLGLAHQVVHRVQPCGHDWVGDLLVHRQHGIAALQQPGAGSLKVGAGFQRRLGVAFNRVDQALGRGGGIADVVGRGVLGHGQRGFDGLALLDQRGRQAVHEARRQTGLQQHPALVLRLELLARPAQRFLALHVVLYRLHLPGGQRVGAGHSLGQRFGQPFAGGHHAAQQFGVAAVAALGVTLFDEVAHQAQLGRVVRLGGQHALGVEEHARHRALAVGDDLGRLHHVVDVVQHAPPAFEVGLLGVVHHMPLGVGQLRQQARTQPVVAKLSHALAYRLAVGVEGAELLAPQLLFGLGFLAAEDLGDLQVLLDEFDLLRAQVCHGVTLKIRAAPRAGRACAASRCGSRSARSRCRR